MIKKTPFLFFLIGALLSQIVSAAALSPIEKQISDYVTQHKDEQLSLLEKLVNINSGTSNMIGVHHVGDILQSQLNQLGFETQWVEEPASMKRAGSLLAKRNGTSGKRLLLIGHLDTVFSIDSPFQSFEQHGNTASGPGVVDDKGGDVVILYALKALQANHALDNTTITVILTGDEEDSGKPTTISRIPLFEAARHSDIALDFECAISNNTASISRRGVSQWMISTQGKEAHSSEIFREATGYGANFELIRILNTMRTQLAGEKYLSFNPGLILGGTTINYEKNNSRGTAFGRENVVANTAMATGDFRFLYPEQKTKIEKRMLAIVKQHLPGTQASLSFEDGIPSMPPTQANLELLRKYSTVSEQLGYGSIRPNDGNTRGAGDISHIASMVSANLVGLGPLGNGIHSTEETVDIPSLTTQTQRAAILIYQLTH